MLDKINHTFIYLSLIIQVPQNPLIPIIICISLQELPEQGITDWMAKTKIYFLNALEMRSLRIRYWQGWFLLRDTKEGSVLGLSPWLVDGYLHPPFTHYLPYLPYICICVQTSLSYKDISNTIFKCILISELILT